MRFTSRLPIPARVRARLAPSRCIVDPFAATDRAVVVLGSARSGTTKVAEALASAPRTRFILEPFHSLRSPLRRDSFVWGQWLDPDDPAPDLAAAWREVLTGRVRDREWLDRYNRARFATRRVVKSIEATNLTGWLRARHPEVPIVYVVRNPHDVTASILRLREREAWAPDWRLLLGEYVDRLVPLMLDGPLRHLADRVGPVWERGLGPYGRSVMRWSLENCLALTDPPAEGCFLLRYEDLVDDPEPTLRALGQFTGLDTARAVAEFHRPSRTDYLGGAGADARGQGTAEWHTRVPDADRREADDVLAAFGLVGYST